MFAVLIRVSERWGKKQYSEFEQHQMRALRQAFNAAIDRVHVHDLSATVLHLLGFDHTKLTYRFQGRDFRLTDVHGNVVKKLLA